jgi:hypothetical protein
MLMSGNQPHEEQQNDNESGEQVGFEDRPQVQGR